MAGETPGTFPPALNRMGTIGESPAPNSAKPMRVRSGKEGVSTTKRPPRLLRTPPAAAIVLSP